MFLQVLFSWYLHTQSTTVTIGWHSIYATPPSLGALVKADSGERSLFEMCKNMAQFLQTFGRKVPQL